MLTVKIVFFLLALFAAVALSDSMHGTEHFHRRSHRMIKKRSTCPTGSTSTNSTAVATATATTAKATATTIVTSQSSKASSSSSKKSSSTSSSNRAVSTAVASTLLAKLFPVSDTASWTTSTSAGDALPLADSTFRPEKVMSGLTHSYVDAPDGTLSMQAIYAAGSWNFEQQPLGGFSFYAPGPEALDLTTAKEVTFGYSVFFPEGYDFVKGGKLPGLYGGDSAEIATGCSGGRRDVRCFSVRLMWRTDGAGEVYTYLPYYTNSGFSANEALCSVPPYSVCNPTYGASVGRGSYTFTTGAWTTVTSRVRMNDNGESNGEIELWANGKSVINVSGLRLTDSSDGRIWGMQMDTFFGGATSDYATPKKQEAYFTNFAMAITETL